jgi:hypothetical protein
VKVLDDEENGKYDDIGMANISSSEGTRGSSHFAIILFAGYQRGS